MVFMGSIPISAQPCSRGGAGADVRGRIASLLGGGPDTPLLGAYTPLLPAAAGDLHHPCFHTLLCSPPLSIPQLSIPHPCLIGEGR